MDFKTMAANLLPFWIAGATMVCATIASGYKDLLRIDKKAVLKFVGFMCAVSLIRFVTFKIAMSNPVLEKQLKDNLAPMLQVPWQGTLFVFWEDAMHTLPIILTSVLLAGQKYAKLIEYLMMAFIMVSFGLGHTYQGTLAAIFISFYIPFAVNAGRKYGVGTVMACHTIYDLATILLFRSLV
jgi:hypothetical protein